MKKPMKNQKNSVNNIDFKYYSNLSENQFREMLPNLDVSILSGLWMESAKLNDEIKSALLRYEMFNIRKLIVGGFDSIILTKNI